MYEKWIGIVRSERFYAILLLSIRINRNVHQVVVSKIEWISVVCSVECVIGYESITRSDGSWPENSFSTLMSWNVFGIWTVLQTAWHMGYLAVEFSSALAWARNTDGDSLTFLMNIMALSVVAWNALALIRQNEFLLLTSLILTLTSLCRYRFWKNLSAWILLIILTTRLPVNPDRFQRPLLGAVSLKSTISIFLAWFS